MRLVEGKQTKFFRNKSVKGEFIKMFESICTALHGETVNREEVKRLRDLIVYEGPDLKKSDKILQPVSSCYRYCYLWTVGE